MKRLILILMVLPLIAQFALANDPAFQNMSSLLRGAPRSAGALAWGDVDNDGDQDLFCGGKDGYASVLYENLNGTFSDVTSRYSLQGVSNVRSAQLIDYDQDGYTDLLCLTDDAHRVRLFHQTQNRRFQQVDIEQWSEDAQPVRSVMWSDVNADGSLDLVLSNGPEQNSSIVVLRQTASEFEQDRDQNLPDEDTGVGAMTEVDFDGDGLLDLFYGYTAGNGRARLYRNYGNGVYADWSSRAGLPEKIGTFGVTWADFNNDQKLDFFVPGTAEYCGMWVNHPYEWLQYKNYVETWELRPSCERTVEAHAVDVNMDGYMDLFVVREDNLGCSLLMNTPNAPWKDAARDLGIDHTRDLITSCAWGDMDNDGDQDLAMSFHNGAVKLYRNDTRYKNEFFMLHLRPLNTQTEAQNCRIYVEFENCKQMASTCQMTSARGGDGSGVTIVSMHVEKSAEGYCRIEWASGAVTELMIGDIRMGKRNTIFEPVGTPDMSVSPESPRPIHVVEIGNAPNPFNPTTSVNIQLSEASYLSLTVFDVLGREIAQLADGEYAAGLHAITFDAGNLPSGLYIARLTAMGETRLHRMLLMK